MFINILILQQNKRQLNSLSLVIIILFSEFPQLLKLSLFLTLTFSPDLAVNLDKKENRVVKRLLCCGSPNWARTSDIMINSQDVYFKKSQCLSAFSDFQNVVCSKSVVIEAIKKIFTFSKNIFKKRLTYHAMRDII